MSLTFPLKYENYLSAAGQAVTVKDSSNNTLGTGTIDASGFGAISVTVPDDFDDVCYLIQDSGSVRIGVDTPDRAMILALQTTVDGLTPNGGTGENEVTVNTSVTGARIHMVQIGGVGDEPLTADIDGSAVFHLATGNWKAIVTAPGYSAYESPSPVAISGTTTITITMTENVIPQPSDPNLATVAFFPIQQGVPLAEIQITYKLAYAGPLNIDGALESFLVGEGITGISGDGLNGGGAHEARTQLYPESVLVAHGVPDGKAYYLVSGSHILGAESTKNVKMYLPDEGGLVGDLIAATAARLAG